VFIPYSAPIGPLSLSDRLALQRTRLANERTLLTYVRTTLALVGFGLALIQFHPERGGRLGYTALASAGVVLAVGIVRFRVHRRQLVACQFDELPTPRPGGVSPQVTAKL
jgi:putative membrane protein